MYYTTAVLCSTHQWFPMTSIKSCSCIYGSAWVWLIQARLGSRPSVQFRSIPGISHSSGTSRLPRTFYSHGHGRSEECKPNNSVIFQPLLISRPLISGCPKWVIWPSPKSWDKKINSTHNWRRKEVNICWAIIQTITQNDVIFKKWFGRDQRE